jgi:hypothetical protein
MKLKLAQITPPLGFKLFVLRGMPGRELTWLPQPMSR